MNGIAYREWSVAIFNRDGKRKQATLLRERENNVAHKSSRANVGDKIFQAQNIYTREKEEEGGKVHYAFRINVAARVPFRNNSTIMKRGAK